MCQFFLYISNKNLKIWHSRLPEAPKRLLDPKRYDHTAVNYDSAFEKRHSGPVPILSKSSEEFHSPCEYCSVFYDKKNTTCIFFCAGPRKII